MSQNQFAEALKFFADRQKDEQKCTALNVQYSTKEKDKSLTVNIEIAKILEAGIADWKNKIYLQLSNRELTQLCEILFGLIKVTEFKHHGVGKNKGLTIHNNNSKGVMLTLSEAGTVFHHLLDHHQRIELGVFIIRRQAEAWKMSVSDVLAVLRQSVAISRMIN